MSGWLPETTVASLWIQETTDASRQQPPLKLHLQQLAIYFVQTNLNQCPKKLNQST